MRGKRMWQTIRLYTILSATKRTQYYKKKKIFHFMGDNCLIMDRKVPLYANLISLGNNVNIASNVHFNTHDIIHRMLNNMPEIVAKHGGKQYPETVGCIEIGDNVFIGAGTSINYNVKIGSNVIIGASSLITKDIPDNSVVGGVPAKTICKFDEYLEKRNTNEDHINNQLESIDIISEQRIWERFFQRREKNNDK